MRSRRCLVSACLCLDVFRCAASSLPLLFSSGGVTYVDEDDRLVQTTGHCKLYEFVTWFDVVKNQEL
jgi:hypothetical protein